MRITLVNYAYDATVMEPEQLLDRYTTLTGWAEAIAATETNVTVAQRFHKDARVVREGIAYVFCADGAGADPRAKLWPRTLHRTVRMLGPDVAHVNGLNVPVQTWLLRRSLPSSTAIVVQDHGGMDGRRLGPARRVLQRARPSSPGRPTSSFGAVTTRAKAEAGHYLRRVAMRAADAFFFTAAASADVWRRAGLISANQPVHQVLESSTAMRPVDRVTARQQAGVEGDPAVLWVGRLNQNKDPLTILEGFERILSRLPSARLTMIYGANDLLPEVRQRVAASPELAAGVRLVGEVPHARMSEFYSAADLFVLGSHDEGGGYALIEACACGLTPVVTDIPPFRAITEGGAIGALWPTGSADAFADALTAAASRERADARQKVLDHFDRALSWPSIAKQATEAYAGILAAVRLGLG